MDGPVSGYDEERIAQHRAICNAATKGPWFLDVDAPYCPVVWTGHEDALGGEVAAHRREHGFIYAPDDYPRGGNNPAESMRFIAAARTGWPEALDEIARLRRALYTISGVSWPDEGPSSGWDAASTMRDIAERALRGES